MLLKALKLPVDSVIHLKKCEAANKTNNINIQSLIHKYGNNNHTNFEDKN
jgi:hypothetical protein